jgi:small subunit ribosomal protein S20
MPLIKSAIKKLRQDKRKTKVNATYKKKYKEATKEALKAPSTKGASKAYAALDKAAKKGIIHKHKAARLKSQAAKAVKKSKSK